MLKKIELWPIIVVCTLLFFSAGALAMVWVAVHNPPEVMQKVDEWK